MAKPSRWTAEKRYQIVKEALSQKEPVRQIARRHQVSEALIYRWREKFFQGGKAALAFVRSQGIRRGEGGIGAPGRRASEVDR
jgi:transposase-like protein